MTPGQRIRNQPAGSSSNILLRNVGGDCSAVDRVWALYVWMDYWITIFNLLFLLISLLSLVVKLIPSHAAFGRVVLFESVLQCGRQNKTQSRWIEVRERKKSFLSVNRSAGLPQNQSGCARNFLLFSTFHDKLACFMNSWNVFHVFRSRHSADSSSHM